MVSITVAVLTYKRLGLLEQCLRSLVSQASEGLFKYSILVVDNDREESARAKVEAISKEIDQPIKYLCEPVKNIATARNRAMLESEDALMAFIDDDEYATSEWLKNLYEACIKNQVDLVNGPVFPKFVSSIKDKRKKFYTLDDYSDGDINYEIMCTNNCLFNLKKAKALGLHFKEEFGLSGGEDQVFFVEFIEKGATKIWARNAKVYEIVPQERTSLRWLAKRHFRYGNSYMRMVMKKKQKSEVRSYLFIRFRLLFRELLNLILFILQRKIKNYSAIDYCISSAFGLGVITAYLGHTYYEYK